jgi:hypothetical protein
MHKYNNQDHSMVTAMLAVENLLGAHHDVWGVNADDEYHEEVNLDSVKDFHSVEQTQPIVPWEVDRAT